MIGSTPAYEDRRSNRKYGVSILYLAKGILQQVLCYDPTAQEMLLDNAFQLFGSECLIVNAFGENHCHRSTVTDTQAVRLGAVNTHLWITVAQFLQPLFEIPPTLVADRS